ncbi:hypothetical protein [Roseibium album]|uniref:hypothetical protein n=1 Tax=Roseibium album TaxID=311410 RepID=UPI0032983CEA
MTQIVHLTAAAEPVDLHSLEDDVERAFGVQLAFEVRGEDEPTAKTQVEGFLNMLAKAVFLLGDWDGTDLTCTRLPRSFEANVDNPPDILNWLETSRQQYMHLAELAGGTVPDPFPFYATERRATADMRNAKAVDLLRASWRWPAPLAQDAGLVSAVTMPAATAAQQFILIAPEGTDPDKVTGTATPLADDDDGLFQLELENDGTPVPYVILTPNLVDLALDLPSGFEESGLFQVPSASEAQHRLLSRIEERAPSLLWAPTVLGEKARRTRSAFEDGDMISGARFDWLVRASAVSIFDVVLAGLLLPVSNTGADVTRRGSVLSRLSRRVAGEYEARNIALDVDEDRLYLNLHEALWTWVSTRTLDDIWHSIADALPEVVSLPKIEAVLTGQMTDNFALDVWEDELDPLAAELGRLAELLESEASGERWLIALLNDALHPETGSQGVAIYLSGTKIGTDSAAEPPGPLVSQLTDELANLFQHFLDDIRGEFNAPEALRQDFGAEAMLLAAQSNLTLSDLRDAITASAPLVNRFGATMAADFFDRLWAPAFLSGQLPPPAELEDLVTEALERNLATLVHDPDQRASFLPDERPQPLWLPIAHRPDAFAGDNTVEHMSGLGFLVRQDERVAHTNLIGLTENTGTRDAPTDPVIENINTPRTVDPFLPLPAPGAAGIALAYSGVPLSSPSLVAPGIGGQSAQEAQQQALIAAMAPFVKTEADYDVEGADLRLPDLAYGKAYHHAAFWVPPSGVLPRDLRKDDNPFIPVLPDGDGSDFWPDGTGWTCQRRVAVATSEILLDPVQEIRDDLHPISRDDPRVVVEGGALRHRDIFRGVGGLGVLNKDDETIFLREVTVAPGFETDHLVVEARVGTSVAPRQVTVAWNASERTLTLTPDLSGLGDQLYWLRLSLTSGQDTAISFADPQNEKGQSTSDRQGHAVLLAPNEAWRLPKERTATLDAPRVSFEVLERWAANEELWTVTCGANAPKVLYALRAARMLFEAIGDPYAERLKALPDPAVGGMLFGLAHSDTTKHEVYTGELTAHGHLPLAPYRDLNPPIDEEEQPLKVPEGLAGEAGMKTLDEVASSYKAFIDALFENARITMSLSEGTLATTVGVNRQIAVTVPAGQAAHLRISPMVPGEHFTGNIFDPRMETLSVGTHRVQQQDFMLFDGPVMAVETMIAPPDEAMLGIERDILTVHGAGRDRGYLLVASPGIQLRQFSQCDLVTQRWRFTGRPIYHWIAPGEGAPTGPVVAVGATKSIEGTPKSYEDGIRHTEIASFEGDAFSDRQPSDGDFKRVRLRPADEKTILGRFDWPERSATYYRHRIELISRYAGAMPDQGAARVIPRFGGDNDDLWAARVAILAEPDAAPLVRPQFRTFLPVQRRVEETLQVGPTPVTCVLSEPPFSQLGLADRIDAELVVKNLFWVDPAVGTLKLRDTRKEISADPLLSYHSVSDTASRSATITAEGPAGLHFDQADTGAPAWSNSQYLLQIDMRNDLSDAASAPLAELEESFAGISLSRRADPGWSWFNKTQTDLSDTAWLALPDGEFESEISAGEETVVKVHRGGDAATVIEVLRDALYKDGGTEDAPFHTLFRDTAHALSIKPLGDNRFRLGVFHRVSGDASIGRIGGAQLVTSAVLTARATGGLTLAGNSSLLPTPVAQSEATLMEWARSARNLLDVAGPDGEPQKVSNLKARYHAGRIHFHHQPPLQPGDQDHMRITAPLARRAYPLHVHRRLAMIVRQPSDQVGHEIDLFHEALLADDWGMAYLDAGRSHPERLSMVLAEMECRAEIVLINDERPGTLPEDIFDTALGPRYKTAHFDLTSTRPANGNIRQVRFHIRAANTHLNLKTLSVRLAATYRDATGEAADSISLSETNFLCQAVDLIVFAQEDGKARLRCQARDLGSDPFEGRGKEFELSKDFDDLLLGQKDDPSSNPTETLMLTIADADTQERWVDVSMLHRRYGFNSAHADAFDFDWLFGAEDLSRLKLPEALSVGQLNALPEAQARLIGLTDPLDILSI